MRSLVPLARLLFAAIFLMSVPGHFQAPTIAYAAQQGVPFATVLVPLSGALALAGGLSILLGWHARAGVAHGVDEGGKTQYYLRAGRSF